jgi:hypothetical protein
MRYSLEERVALAKQSKRTGNRFGELLLSRSDYLAVLAMNTDDQSYYSLKTEMTEINRFLKFFEMAPCNANGSHLFGRSGLQRYFLVELDPPTGKKRYAQLLGRCHFANFQKVSFEAWVTKECAQVKCAHCDKFDRNEADHKEGREPFKQGLDLSDAQSLCRPDNSKKREACKRCVQTDQRFNAMVLGYSVGWIEGDAVFASSPLQHGCVGCYWYDCLKFKALVSKDYKP